MATASPPKPWERGGAAALSSTPGATSSPATMATTSSASSTSVPPTTASTSSSNPPSLPSRPSTLNAVVNRTASNYSPYNSPYGSFGGGYSGYGGLNSYSSPYSRLGGMGSYGGYGGLYGGMGGMGGMGSMGGMGGMYGGRQGDPNDPNSLTNSFNQSTQATFQLIESIVGAFGGFAQMLESTYMATHSSFFAMVSVAEQFGNLRNTLGSVLGIFTIMRWMRTLFARLTGRPLPADATSLTPSAFAAFQGKSSSGGSSSARPSRKPFIMFLVAVFGLPYLMGKLIRALARSQEEEAKRHQQLVGVNESQPLDPTKLDFCRVAYDYTPADGSAVEGIDLPVKKGDLVAVLSKTDPIGNPSEWWRCRARDGRVGYLPSPYLETIQRRSSPAAIQAATSTGSQSAPVSSANSRTHTLTTESTASLKGNPGKPPAVSSKMGDVTVESFQKSGFYS
ncbi:MAG: Peroxisomal membrane protein PAS20 [Cirrosporium novae-zelandiae]|nr:MAG: Peroxisomal membrane protein PAS20 [Cirrosporium novae-zelandiae]